MENFLRRKNLVENKPYIFDYIKSEISEKNISRRDLIKIKKEYEERYQGVGKASAKFLKDSLGSSEKEMIKTFFFIDPTKKQPNFDDEFEKHINFIFGKIRASLAHQGGEACLSVVSEKPCFAKGEEYDEVEDMGIRFMGFGDYESVRFINHLSVGIFVQMIWLAIFRSLNISDNSISWMDCRYSVFEDLDFEIRAVDKDR